jgi:hypothetical protein
VANIYGMIVCMTGSSGLEQLRRLAAARRQLDEQIDTLTESLLRDGEFVEDIAGAQGVSREKIRRFRKDHDIPDTREIRRSKGAPARRAPGGTHNAPPEG